MQRFIQILIDILQTFFPKKASANDKQPPVESAKIIAVESVKVVTVKEEVVIVEPPQILEPPKVESPSKRFLICPIAGNDASGNPLTAYIVRISAVVDHSGTAIDPGSKKWWGKNAKDSIVKAFNGEVGDGDPTSGAPFGYAKKIPAPFFSSKEINYVGVRDPNDKYGPTYYLNYDGHAGYDFPYPKMTPVVAPASGNLFKAAKGKDAIYGASWDTDHSDHSFYIQHANGYLTWFRHCEKLEDSVEAQILSDLSKACFVEKGQVIAYVGNAGTPAVHLHFEVRNEENVIVDPYGDRLWETQ